MLDDGRLDACKARAPTSLLLAARPTGGDGGEGGKEGGGGGPRVKGERIVFRIIPVRPCGKETH